ncbi:flagellin-like protein [Methanohalophilus levihalophilus]|uniref:type IV pilin n=1 Tax=Methanohalophilus levihalophilus TaxID=1431282 RepID=UPI001AE8D1EC|nr:type IV pilin N-terminal domain-containing protein [Methanohalophilus levihalophilus]MBP2029183.1 flagellin-like protein [Methanohalophilus levihalophilus]
MKLPEIFKRDDAVSPVIGVILMVAITVILAAVIAAFVFGLGSPETAPQASVKGSTDTVNSNSAVKVEHQGGDAITMITSNTKVTVDGTEIDTYNTSAADKFEAGETLYLVKASGGEYTLGNLSSTTVNATAAFAAAGETVNIKVIDVPTQQLIADFDVRF